MTPEDWVQSVGRAELALAVAVAGFVVMTAAVVPLAGQARPAFEIPVRDVTDGEGLDRSTGEAWNEVPAATVPLSSSGAAVPNADDVTVERVSVAAARSDERLYLRLSWADKTRDTNTTQVRRFADAVAVQLPAEATARPPVTMGSTDNRVNVWYWDGSGATQELLAGGPGTTTQFAESTVRTNATHTDGRWQVVLSRPLSAASENRTAVPTDADMDIALAVWNGSNMERSGQKAVSEWYYLALGPGPQGPPYETILWAVAGIGIVVTTLVTIEGVRRTRSE